MTKLIKFPHINQLRNVVETVRGRAAYHTVTLPKLIFHGTVKLHGTNSSVCRDMSTGETWCQSRETIITPETDNAGFARFCAENVEAINTLFSAYECGSGVMSIYGEWCGKGIMKGVGINNIEKMFVVFGVKITFEIKYLPWVDIEITKPQIGQKIVGRTIDFNTWEESWGEISDEPLGAMTHWITPEFIEDAVWLQTSFTKILDPLLVTTLNTKRIFDIEEFPTFDVTVDFNDADKSVDELVKLTDRVETQCPVALAFGAIGIGEGLAWKCIQKWYSDKGEIKTSDLRFKTKGLKHKESANDKPSADPIKVASIQKFVDEVATVHRFEKMLEKLEIAGVVIKMENTGQFLKLIGEDIMREEGDVLTVSGLDRKDVMSSVNNAAKRWWISIINSRPL